MKSDVRERSRRTRARVNFGKAKKYPRRRDRIPLYDQDASPRSNRSGNGEWDDFDEILGNFGDWGDH